MMGDRAAAGDEGPLARGRGPHVGLMYEAYKGEKKVYF